MEQRLFDPADYNSGKIDFPGGHLKGDESFKDAALREYREEVGLPLPAGEWGGEWETKDGRRRGFVYRIANEKMIDLRAARTGVDPDMEGTGEADSLLWMMPTDLADNPMMRRDIREHAEEIADAVDAGFLVKGWRESAKVVKETYTPNAGMKTAAERALRWKDEGKANGAGTPVGWGRATDIVAGRPMSEDVVKRMYSFFARHEVDKQGKDFTNATDPSKGRIMWDAWGGDAGFSWSKTIVERLKNAELKKQGDASPVAKAWRESANHTPQNEYDLKLTDYYSPKVSEALVAFASSLPIRSTWNILKDRSTLDKKALRAQAVSLLGRGDGEKLLTVLRDIVADGWVAGAHAAEVQIGQHLGQMKKATVDWDNWIPGDTAAALRAANGGLAEMLAKAGITVAGIEESTLNDIGNALANGLAAGLSPESIGRNITDLVGAKWRADMIAHTESSRALVTSTLDTYSQNSVSQFDWRLSDGACPECEEYSAGSPYYSDDVNNAPPGHPYCRCSTLPVIAPIDVEGIMARYGNVESNLGGAVLGTAAGLALGAIAGALAGDNSDGTPVDDEELY